MDYIQKFKNLREDHDFTQEFVASYLGTSQTMYARYERRANELPLRHFIQLCKLYNVSADSILAEEMKKDNILNP
ncbi:MAG: helix-turn-helix domain-containing protein [Lachnospiraceae bacterium]|nr:helix-turn-helix domain-containing protein [Lachnospiraceae bacterium]